MSRFGTPATGAPAPAVIDRQARAALAASVIDGRTFRDVAVLGTAERGRLRLLSRGEVRQVRADARAALAAVGLTSALPGQLEGHQEWRDEIVCRSIAVAVRDPADPDQRDPRPLASLADWETCSDVQLVALWEIYKDLDAELDPFTADVALDEDDHRAIREAAKKKDGATLTSFGSQKLALFAISSIEVPAT